jgi:hypothetical protein
MAVGYPGKLGQNAADRPETQVVSDVGRIGNRSSGQQPAPVTLSGPVQINGCPVPHAMSGGTVAVAEPVPHRLRQFADHGVNVADL